MLSKLRERSHGEAGFTLVELLVVMLILGLLAAIAIPSFFNQRDKARDADAKATVRTAETAMETYATDHQGSYAGVSANGAELVTIENTLSGKTIAVSYPAGSSYKVSVTANTGNVFSIERSNAGSTALTCTTAGTAGCPSNGNWG